MNNSFNDLFNTNPKYSTSIAFILGLVLIDNLTAAEQNMLGNWIILLGQTIITNSASQNAIESRIKGGIININSKEIKCLYNPIIYNIDKIRKIINDAYPNNNKEIDIIIKSINELKDKIEKLNK